MKNFQPDSVRRILALMMGGIGNLVLLTPALRSLHRACPNGQITLLTAEVGVEGILSNEGLIDRTICVSGGGRGFLKAFRQLRTFGFDLALTASHTNPVKASTLTYLLGIPVRVGQSCRGCKLFYTDAADLTCDTHEIDGSLVLLETIGVKTPRDERLPVLHPTRLEMNAVQHFLKDKPSPSKRLIGMHAGSGSRQIFKRWPAERFAETADRLVDIYNAEIIFTGGAQEHSLVTDIIRMMRNKAINTAGIFSIRETAALIQACSGFISNDSGLAHIAAATGTPLVVLFGPTNLRRIAPRGGKVRIVQSQCEPPIIAPGNRVAGLRAMEKISVDVVLEECKSGFFA